MFDVDPLSGVDIISTKIQKEKKKQQQQERKKLQKKNYFVTGLVKIAVKAK